MNTFEMAQVMFKILREKKEVTLEDIVIQFQISASTAYNVQRILKSLCERTEECEATVRNRRTIFIWKGKEESNKETLKQEDVKEIENILNAKPEGS